MYLNRLNDEQKDLFIDLCIHAAYANEKFVDEEKELINAYCDEMHLSDVRYESRKTLDDVTDRLTEISSKTELRIILLEIGALMLSDNVYDEHEQAFMKELAHRSGLTDKGLEEMFDCLKGLTSLYARIDTIINDD